ncbi:heterogeneous nuclear ribonucleoprotein 1-like [Phragmites australis]|uniref:heterogeneous nuclear ribonucleoprotein 1-like n=1 Tax=Phragmites australis TaxID=29695 RepID=UPI002D79781E|nr:heterogeneous nuclear ribonucleoprotein 1-like [Phragmites australis]
MESDQGKLFIGGISWETSEEKLSEHFSAYGEVTQAAVMRDKLTGRPRGFGFVVFADPAVVDRALQDPHSLDGRTVDVKRALSREEQQASKVSNPSVGRNSGGGGGSGGGGDAGGVRTKKIFVGGLPSTLTEDGFRQYFQTYGIVTDVVVMYDQNTQRPRGFGFITFDSEDAVDRVLHKTFHDLGGKMVEVKRALPREANPGSGGGRSMGGGGYQSNNGHNSNSGSYDGRGDASRYGQAQQGSGGYPGYGAGGYGAGAAGYGYGANPGAGYGNYGAGGYGGVPAGYGGPYGNPSAAGSGYQGGLPGSNRGPWGSQAPSAYGAGSYGGNTGYGAWNNSSVGGNAPTSQAPGAAVGYGSQGYGYGGYGGDGSYASHGGYGAYGARSDGSGNPATGGASGYGAGYGSGSGNSGYPNAWSDPSQGGGFGGSVNGGSEGQSNYGSGYGAVQPRVAQ